jgi:hypothetical protein
MFAANPDGDAGEPYVVLEWLDGPSLAELLAKEGGKLPLARALHIVLALADSGGRGPCPRHRPSAI